MIELSLYYKIKTGIIRVNNRSPLPLRFWDGVSKDGPVCSEHGKCWVWTKHKFDSGYGRIMVSGHLWRAHRCSWLLHNGDIPDGMCVLHKCDNPICVNPGHLFLGTSPENTEDMVEKGRQAKGEGHWKARLTEEAVLEIRRTYRRGSPVWGAIPMGVRHGISKETILDIVHNRTWKYLL